MNAVQMGMGPKSTNLPKVSDTFYAPETHVNGQNVNNNMSSEGKVNNGSTGDLKNYSFSNEYMSCNFTDDISFDGNVNSSYLVPHNAMPPPNIINNNIMMHNFNGKECFKAQSDGRSNSPNGSESDESIRSCTGRDSPPDDKANKSKSKNGVTCYNNQLLYNKYSHSSPSVFFGGGVTHLTMNNKPRYYHQTNNGRHRRDSKRNQPLDINRRVYGLMERFTSKAKLFSIISNPQKLLTGSFWDQMNQSIWDVYSANAQTEKTYIHKLELWRMVYIHIRKILERYGLFMVGSTMSGLGTEKSDIDMCLLVKPCLDDPRSDALSYLQNIQTVLYNSDFVEKPEVILAKVPILKFRDSQYGFEVDLNCNNAVGIRNTHLLHCYAHLDWRVRPLVTVVKLWAQANDINDAKNMTISSYSLALMVIHFLQCGVNPPALPCLHEMYPEKFSPTVDIHYIDIQEELPKFSSDNKQSLGELFLGFLHYYTVFNYDLYAISVREGRVLMKDECRMARAPKNDTTQWKLLCIEEPFDLTNTARSVYDVDTFDRIKYIFHFAYNVLRETKDLSSIIPHAHNTSR